MNLFDALNYRNDCLICQQPMDLKCNERLTVKADDNGLIITRSKQLGVRLNFNGTCQKISKLGFHNRISPLTISKECYSCRSSSKNRIKLKTRSLGHTTIERL